MPLKKREDHTPAEILRGKDEDPEHHFRVIENKIV